MGPESIRYGSNDAGKTIHTKDANLNLLIANIGRELNLRGRSVNGVNIYGPADLEGHAGSDGKYYALDFGRGTNYHRNLLQTTNSIPSRISVKQIWWEGKFSDDIAQPLPSYVCVQLQGQ